jgi:serine/threonine-protein kinase
MGSVWIATNMVLERKVAIKVVHKNARDDLASARLLREARAAAKIGHANIVQVYDFGYLDSGEPFIVMELLRGQTLRQRLGSDAPLTVGEAVRVIVEVLGALEYAHRAGIVHRDIKPANVMITDDGAIKVMDFGIARPVGAPAATGTGGGVAGSPPYMSPEQVMGKPLDATSDIYSTGCVLFELLTGRPPFVGSSDYAILSAHREQAPPLASNLNPHVTPELDRLLLRALAKEPEGRFRSAEAFAEALGRFDRADAPQAPGPTSLPGFAGNSRSPRLGAKGLWHTLAGWSLRRKIAAAFCLWLVLSGAATCLADNVFQREGREAVIQVYQQRLYGV